MKFFCWSKEGKIEYSEMNRSPKRFMFFKLSIFLQHVSSFLLSSENFNDFFPFVIDFLQMLVPSFSFSFFFLL